MKKLLRLIGYLAVAVVVLGVVASLALRIFLPPEKVKALILKQVHDNLHREVQLGAVSVGVLQGLSVLDFKLSEQPDFSRGTFISSEKFVIRLRLLPLLAKKVMVKDVLLDHPIVNVVRYPDGVTYNFSSLTSGSTSQAATPGPASASAPHSDSSISLLVSRASINKGALQFTDQSPAKQSLTIDPLDVRVRNFSLTSLMDVQTQLKAKIKGLDLALDFDGQTSLGGTLKIKKLALVSGLSKIDVKGSADKILSDQPAFDVNLDLSNITPALLAAAGPFPPAVTLQGGFSGTAHASGTKSDLAFSSSINLTKLGVTEAGVFSKAPDVPMQLDANGTLKQFKELALDNFKFSLNSFKLTGKGAVHNVLDDNRNLNLHIESNEFPIADLLGYLPNELPKDVALSGNAKFSTDVAGTPAACRLTLTADLTSADVKYAETFRKPAGTGMTVAITGTYDAPGSLNASNLKFTLARMEIGGTAVVNTAGKSLAYTANLKSNSFPLEDVAKLVPMLQDYKLAGTASTTVRAKSAGVALDANGSLTLQNGSAHYQKSDLTQLATSVDFGLDDVSIPKLTGKLNGADLALNMTGHKLRTHPAINATINAAELDLNKLIPAAPPVPKKAEGPKDSARALAWMFVGTAWALEPAAKGFADLPMDLSGKLTVGKITHDYFNGQNLDARWNLTNVTPDLGNVNGTATLKQGKGVIQNVQKLAADSKAAKLLFTPITVLQKLGKAGVPSVKLPSLDPISFDEILGDYAFQSGVMNVKSFAMNGPDIITSMTGTVGLAGAQALNLKIVLKLAAGYVGGAVGDFLKDEQGRSTLNLSVKGTVADPKPGLDTAATQKQAVDKLKGDFGKSLLKKLGVNLGGDSSSQAAPSQAAPADNSSAAPADNKNEQINQLQNVLKGIFKH